MDMKWFDSEIVGLSVVDVLSCSRDEVCPCQCFLCSVHRNRCLGNNTNPVDRKQAWQDSLVPRSFSVGNLATNFYTHPLINVNMKYLNTYYKDCHEILTETFMFPRRWMNLMTLVISDFSYRATMTIYQLFIQRHHQFQILNETISLSCTSFSANQQMLACKNVKLTGEHSKH